MRIYIVKSDTDQELGQLVDTSGQTFKGRRGHIQVIEGFGDLDVVASRQHALDKLVETIATDSNVLTRRRPT
jgi:hypothetical protein